MIRAGIVGMGRMGFSHAAIVNAHPDAQVVSVCEPSALVRGAIQKHTTFTSYKNLEEMIASEELDCVVITTPTRFHYSMAHDAIAAGLHVFVEKPLCLTPEESGRLVEEAREKGVVNQVGYHNRFVGTFREAERLLSLGAIGDVYHVLGEAYGPVVLREKRGTWRSDAAKGGGCLYDYATHVINLVQYLVGAPTGVSGVALKQIYSRGVDDAVYATLKFDGNLTGQLSVNWSDETYRKMSTSVTVLGTRGKIVANVHELKVYFRDEPGIDEYIKGWNERWVTDLSPDVVFYLRGEEYSAQTEYFLGHIADGNMENINSFADAFQTDRIVASIQATSDNGGDE
jgi:predicted dehydrogenase